MLKKLLLSGAAFAALTAYATAQTAPAEPATPPAVTAPAAPGAQDPATMAQQKTDPNLYSNIKGAEVVGMNDESLGSVADILVDSSGQVKSLVIGHGGLVGIGKTYRNYEVSQLPAVADGKLNLGQFDTASLETLPQYEYPKAETGRAATDAAPGGVTAPDSNAPAAPDASMPSANAELWPASYLVGAKIGGDDSKKSISDIRFDGDRVAAVLIDEGSLGLGNNVQEVAFEDLTISGSPAEPQISMAAGGAAPSTMPDATAPDATAPATEAPSAAPPAEPTAPAPTP